MRRKREEEEGGGRRGEGEGISRDSRPTRLRIRPDMTMRPRANMKPLPQPIRKPRAATVLFLGFTAITRITITRGRFPLLLLPAVSPEDLDALFN